MKIIIDINEAKKLCIGIAALVVYLSENPTEFLSNYEHFSKIVEGITKAFGADASRYFINILMGNNMQKDSSLKPIFIAIALQSMCYFYSASNYRKRAVAVNALKTTIDTQLKLPNGALCNGSTTEVFNFAINEFIYYICRLHNEASGYQLAKLHTHLSEFWESIQRHLITLELNISSSDANNITACLYWLLEIVMLWIDSFLATDINLPQDVRNNFEKSREIMGRLYSFYTEYIVPYQVLLRYLFRYQDGNCSDALVGDEHNKLYKISLKAKELQKYIIRYTHENNIKYIKTSSLGTRSIVAKIGEPSVAEIGEPRVAKIGGPRVLTAAQIEQNNDLVSRFADSFTGNAVVAIGTNTQLRLILVNLAKSTNIFETISILFSSVDKKKEDVLNKIRCGTLGDGVVDIDEYKRRCWFDLFLMLLQIIHGHRQQQTGDKYSIVDGSEVSNYIEEILNHLRIFNLDTLSNAYLQRKRGHDRIFTDSGYTLSMLEMLHMTQNALNAYHPDTIQLLDNIGDCIAQTPAGKYNEPYGLIGTLIKDSILMKFLFSQFVIMGNYKSYNCAKVINQVRMHYQLFNDDVLVLEENPLICHKVGGVLSERSKDCISKPIASVLFQMVYSLSKVPDCDLTLLEYLFRLLCATVLYNREFLWTNEDESEGISNREKKIQFLIKIFCQVKNNITEARQYGFFKGTFVVNTVLSANNAMGSIEDDVDESA